MKRIRHAMAAARTLHSALLAVPMAAALAVGVGSSGGAPVAAPRCYGAAARDPAHPCTNVALGRRVIPTPNDALLVPDAPCAPVAQEAALNLCTFGGATAAGRTVALLGDSHASSWRAALSVAVDSERWRGVSLTRSSCPFSRAAPRINVQARASCQRWNDGVIAWFTAHPEVHDVFVSAHAGAPVLREGRRISAFETKVVGYAAGWAALPGTVTRIIVLRDVPTHPLHTADCIDAALAAHRPPIPRCAVRRAGALLPDAEVAAARRLASPRVRVIDLTPFMCGPRWCYPVVGGVLVDKDTNHLSQAFSTTLGPYLLQRALALMAP